jgi:argininosuccinate synthase
MSDIKRPEFKRVVLAYSGGLDTSVILKWLQVNYNCEVVTFTADLGQEGEVEPARQKALSGGVKPEHIYIDDVREEFVRDFVFPMMRANARYEGDYLLGTSIARPLISKRLVEIARETGADAVAHGATGKGNDQVRFELGVAALAPDLKVIAPWREWDLTSRTALIQFAEEHQIQVPKDKRGESPFSTDANLLHTSSEGKVLEDPWEEVPDYVFSRTVNPEDAPDQSEYITVDFERGDGVAINGIAMSPATLLTQLNEYGRKHGIGRLDLVENRFVGPPRDRADHARPRGRPPQGRAHAQVRRAHLQRLLVRSGARDAPGRDRPQPGQGLGHRPAQALQGHGLGRRPQVAEQPVFRAPRHVRGRRRRLRSEGRRGLHPAQCPPVAVVGRTGSLNLIPKRSTDLSTPFATS